MNKFIKLVQKIICKLIALALLMYAVFTLFLTALFVLNGMIDHTWTEMAAEPMYWVSLGGWPTYLVFLLCGEDSKLIEWLNY